MCVFLGCVRLVAQSPGFCFWPPIYAAVLIASLPSSPLSLLGRYAGGVATVTVTVVNVGCLPTCVTPTWASGTRLLFAIDENTAIGTLITTVALAPPPPGPPGAMLFCVFGKQRSRFFYHFKNAFLLRVLVDSNDVSLLFFLFFRSHSMLMSASTPTSARTRSSM